MSKPTLIYFDAPVSRGEECRLALHLAGVDFEDRRIPVADWPVHKPGAPYGAMPVLEIPGQAPLAQTNAILVLIGRRHGLHPKDDFEAARHEAMMAHVEDLRAAVGPTLRMEAEEKRRAREALVAGYLPQWAAAAERNILAQPFFGGDQIQVVDLKLHMAVRWFNGGKLDHVPADIFSAYPRLMGVHEAVKAHPGVQAWYDRA